MGKLIGKDEGSSQEGGAPPDDRLTGIVDGTPENGAASMSSNTHQSSVKHIKMVLSGSDTAPISKAKE